MKSAVIRDAGRAGALANTANTPQDMSKPSQISYVPTHRNLIVEFAQGEYSSSLKSLKVGFATAAAGVLR